MATSLEVRHQKGNGKGRMFKNLAAGGQTTAHGVRMLRARSSK